MPEAELLQSASKDALVDLVLQLQGLARAQEQIITETAAERDAAQMWNELYMKSKGECDGR
ncbi:MAG TPA: hypothetical protein VII58_00830 [Acidobacteriaceae bacterium]